MLSIHFDRVRAALPLGRRKQRQEYGLPTAGQRRCRESGDPLPGLGQPSRHSESSSEKAFRQTRQRRQGSQRLHTPSETQHHFAAWLVVADFHISVMDPRNGRDEAQTKAMPRR